MAQMTGNRTYRIVDEERIDGILRPIFIWNGGDFYLTDLKIFADGAIHYWEWGDLDGLRSKLAAGWVATTLDEGARASAHDLASRRFGKVVTWITAEELLGEVVDAIDRLNGRPDSTDRCITQALRYVDSRTETDRMALHAAYEAIPAHHRIYALGDMDARDSPLRLLISEVGETWDEYVLFEFDDGGEALTEDCAVTDSLMPLVGHSGGWARISTVASSSRCQSGSRRSRRSAAAVAARASTSLTRIARCSSPSAAASRPTSRRKRGLRVKSTRDGGRAVIIGSAVGSASSITRRVPSASASRSSTATVGFPRPFSRFAT